jgi:transcriptional regulator with XRE-family HTH domain
MAEETSLAVVLRILREAKGLKQKDVAERLGRHPTLVSALELGNKPLDRDRLEEVIALLGYASEAVDLTLAFLDLLPLTWLSPGGTEAERSIPLAAARVATVTAEATVEAFTRSLRQAVKRREERQAEAQWELFRTFSPADQQLLIAHAPEYHTAAFCARLCTQSEKAAADRPNRALELARLALEVAEKVPGTEAERDRLRAGCWAQIGNALRVGNAHDAADAAFVRVRELWKTGQTAELGFVEEWQLLDLEASLRRDERRFEEALALHDRAWGLAKSEGQAIH